MGFDSPLGPEDLFHFKIGKFAPDVVDGFQEMWLSTDAGIDTLSAFNRIGINGGTGLSRRHESDADFDSEAGAGGRKLGHHPPSRAVGRWLFERHWAGPE